jgi:O-antigen/teichoic acid export membrane protein
MFIFYTIAALLAAAALTVAFIPYVGPIVAAGLAALAAVSLGLAIFFNYHLNNVRKFLDEQLREMDEAKIRFTDIVDEIIANCCSGCIDVNLELPRCPSI